MTKVLKTYSGTFREQLSAYRADRCETDFLFKMDCEAARHPVPRKKKPDVTDKR